MSTTTATPHHTPEGRARIAAASAANAKTRTRVGGRFAKKSAPVEAIPAPIVEAPIPTAPAQHQALLPLPGDTAPITPQEPTKSAEKSTAKPVKKSAPPASAGARAAMQSLGIGQSESERHREALSLVAQHSRTISQLQSERTKLKEELVEAKAESGRLRLALDQRNTQYRELEISETNLTTTLDTVNEQLTAISGMLPLELLPTATPPERLAQYIADLGEMADEWEKTANQRQEAIESQRFEIARLTQILSNNETTTKGLREEIAELETGRDALQVERDQARAEVRRLRDEARGSFLASLFLMAIGGGGGALFAWLVRGWLHA